MAVKEMELRSYDGAECSASSGDSSSQIRMKQEMRRKKTVVFGDTIKYDEENKENNSSKHVIGGGVDRLHMCVDNKVFPISHTHIVCNSSRVRMRSSHTKSLVNDYEIWKPIRVIIDGRGRKKIMKGEEFGEVYSVRLRDFGGKPSRKIHGLVWLNTTLGHTYLFRRNNKNPMTISRDQDMLPLAGPIVATFGDDWGVMVTLWEGEDEICRGHLDDSDMCKIKLNQPMTRKFRGSNGSAAVEVNFAGYTDAVLCEVEIRFIENENTVSKIFGRISASVDNDKKLTSTIFEKNVDESISLCPGKVIPLSRPLLSVPLSSYLLIKVDLRDESSNKPLVQGSLRFAPEYFGGDLWTLIGECGKIEVKLTWFNSDDHPKSMARLWHEPYLNNEVDVNELCPDREGEISGIFWND